jgi:hypothetical protein
MNGRGTTVDAFFFMLALAGIGGCVALVSPKVGLGIGALGMAWFVLTYITVSLDRWLRRRSSRNHGRKKVERDPTDLD